MITTIKGQTVASNCTAADSIIKKYKDDADRLALSRTSQLNDAYNDSVEIDKPMSNTYLRALLAVYNATALPARDTVVRLLHIHKYPSEMINQMVFNTSASTYSWAQNIQNGISPSGYAALDSVMSRYHLYVQNFSYFQGSTSPVPDIVTLQRDSNMNVPALMHIFTSFVPFAFSPGQNIIFGDGPQIADSITTNFIQLKYIFKWYDCPNGCLDQRTWIFRVYNDCSVAYLGSFGDAVAPLFTVGLPENTINQNNWRISPNPSNGYCTLHLSAGNFKLRLSDITGGAIRDQAVYIKPGESDYPLKVDDLPRGIYFLSLQSENKSASTKKLIIEQH